MAEVACAQATWVAEAVAGAVNAVDAAMGIVSGTTSYF